MATTSKSKAKRSTPEQQAKNFRALAEELECDDDEAAFDERLRKIATAPRQTPETKGDK